MTPITPIRHSLQLNKLAPGNSVKGKTLQQIDKNHYLISINGKKMIAYSEQPLKENQTITAYIKGNYPQLFLKINSGQEQGQNHLQESIPGNLKEQFFYSFINGLLTKFPKITPSLAKGILLFMKNRSTFADLLNNSKLPGNFMDLLKESPFLLNNILKYTHEKGVKDLSKDMIKFFTTLKNEIFNSEKSSETMKELFTEILGNEIYNRKNENGYLFFPVLYYEEERWIQMTGRLKKKKAGENTSYLQILADFSFSGPIEIDFCLKENQYLILKIKGKNEPFLQLITENSQELKENLKKAGIIMIQINTEITSENLPISFFTDLSNESKVIDFQV